MGTSGIIEKAVAISGTTCISVDGFWMAALTQSTPFQQHIHTLMESYVLPLIATCNDYDETDERRFSALRHSVDIEGDKREGGREREREISCSSLRKISGSDGCSIYLIDEYESMKKSYMTENMQN